METQNTISVIFDGDESGAFQVDRNRESRELSLGDDFGPAAISVNGITLTIDADGKSTLAISRDVTIITKGSITSYTNGTALLKMPVPEQSNVAINMLTEQAYAIGDVLPDGWVVGPVSSETGLVMAIEPVSSALDDFLTWNQGQEHAAELRSQGNANARQPSANELTAIYNTVVKDGRNENALFNTCVSNAQGGRYWTSTLKSYYPVTAWILHLGIHGMEYDGEYADDARVRCVRDESWATILAR